MKLFGAHTARVNNLVRAFGVMMVSCLWLVQAAQANDFKINEIIVDGNRRIETATISSYTEIETPAVLTTGAVNDAVQRVRASNLFESVSAEVQGNRLRSQLLSFRRSMKWSLKAMTGLAANSSALWCVRNQDGSIR